MVPRRERTTKKGSSEAGQKRDLNTKQKREGKNRPTCSKVSGGGKGSPKGKNNIQKNEKRPALWSSVGGKPPKRRKNSPGKGGELRKKEGVLNEDRPNFLHDKPDLPGKFRKPVGGKKDPHT